MFQRESLVPSLSLSLLSFKLRMCVNDFMILQCLVSLHFIVCSRLFHSLFQTGLSFLSLTLLLFNGILIGCNRCAKRARVKSKEKKGRNRKKVFLYSTPTHKHIKRQQQHHATKQKEHRHINRRKVRLSRDKIPCEKRRKEKEEKYMREKKHDQRSQSRIWS